MDCSVGGITIQNDLKTYCVTLNDLNTVLTAKNSRDGFILFSFLTCRSRKIEMKFFANSEQTLASQRYSQYEQLLFKR